MLRRPMNRTGKLHALLSTARVANIPSVVANVWLGVALAAVSGAAPIGWSAALCLAGAGVALYLAGNFLNDWADRAWDAQHRPERALPRGLFAASLYARLAVFFAILGLTAAASVSIGSALAAAGIVGCIGIYTYSHKRSPWAVIPMGMCRALLPVLGVLGFVQNPAAGLWVWTACAAGGLLAYIMGLSLSARYESMAEPPRGAAVGARILLVLAALIVSCPFDWISDPPTLWARFLPYGMWLVFCLTLHRKPVPVHVSSLLAGIPLLDWVMMMPLVGALKAMDGGWNPFSIACCLLPPLAFIAALLLQRLAPAT